MFARRPIWEPKNQRSRRAGCRQRSARRTRHPLALFDVNGDTWIGLLVGVGDLGHRIDHGPRTTAAIESAIAPPSAAGSVAVP